MSSFKVLKYALALSEHRNFTVTARALGISQSALSRAIQKLENDLKVPLFDRGRPDVKPTPFGRAYLERAAGIMRQLEEAEREVRMMSGLEKGTLRVGFGPVYSASLAGPAVGRFIQQHPQIEVKILLGEWPALFAMLLTDEIDLYVGEISVLDRYSGFKKIPLSTQSGVFFCRPDHPLLEHAPVTTEELAAYPLATVALPARANDFLAGMVRLERSPHEVAVAQPPIECENFFVSKGIVANSHAIGLATIYVLRDEFEAGTLRELKVKGNRLASQGGIVFKDGDTLSPSAQAFITYLIESDRGFGEASPHIS